MKKLLILILMLSVACCALGSCLLGGGDGGNEPYDEITGLTRLIKPEGSSYPFGYNDLINKYFASCGTRLELYNDSDCEAAAGELIIGATDRALTRSAAQELSRVLSGGGVGDEIGYILYSDGSSLALVWSDEYVMQPHRHRHQQNRLRYSWYR